jgi:hypothetical protein
VFVSYSHVDEHLYKEFDSHISILRRQNVLGSWHDRRLVPGDDWHDQLNIHLHDADIVLLLVSASFLSSDYCFEVEMKAALARHDAGAACVVPVIVRACAWKDSPLGRIQAMPKDGRPVMQYPDRDEAWTDVVNGLKIVSKELLKKRKT